MGLSGLVAFAKRFTRQPVEPISARVSRPRPFCSARYEEILGCPVKFCDEDAIAFRRADLSMRLISANQPLAAVLEQQTETALARLIGTGFVDKVRAVVQRVMRVRDPSISAIAGELAMSMRTLQRRLAEEGMRFNDLVDDIRRDTAERYLSSGRINTIEVAFLLGFADPNSFYRAFKRWTGTTPMLYRQQALQAAACQAPG
jgi:AraC-like DNA-binding protein